MTFRNVGPFRTAAWSPISPTGSPARDHLYTIYAATRSGAVEDHQRRHDVARHLRQRRAAPIGAVTLSASHPNISDGTGEQAVARSSYSGKGVFSPWTRARLAFHGLPDSHHIAASSSTRRSRTWCMSRHLDTVLAQRERGVSARSTVANVEKVLYSTTVVGGGHRMTGRTRHAVCRHVRQGRRPWHSHRSGPERAL